MRPLLILLAMLTAAPASAAENCPECKQPIPSKCKSCGQVLPPPNAGLKLVWQDEFSGTKIDAKKWTPHPHWESSYDPKSVFVRDGAVHLVLRRANNYQDVTLSSHGKFEPHHGYLEARIKYNIGRGSHPAFYLESAQHLTNPNWQNDTFCGEIDIWEMSGIRPAEQMCVLHSNTGGRGGEEDRVWSHYSTIPNPADWHVYGVRRSRDSVDFYRDGKLLARGPADHEHAAKILRNVDQTMHVMLANWRAKGGWNPEPDKTSPAEMTVSVDWVRFWQ